MEFIFLVLLEIVLLLSAGMIFIGGAWGNVAAAVALSGINYLVHDIEQFWCWEVPLLLGGIGGFLLLLVVGRIGDKSKVVTDMVGGMISLVFFGAFITPIAAIILWALVVATGFVRKDKKNKVLRNFAPMILRLLLGIGWIIYGNIFTL